jgi:hypothetical protein
MTTTNRGCAVHRGSYQSIPSSASPGLLFLKLFLPIIDSLDESQSLDRFCLPGAQFHSTLGDPVLLEQLPEIFRKRRDMLQFFSHDVSSAWEIEGERSCTVIFEGVSRTQFKGDCMSLTVAEMNVWELEREKEGGELKLIQARCYMDPSAVQNRAKQIVEAK